MYYDWPQLMGTFTIPVSMTIPLFTTNVTENIQHLNVPILVPCIEFHWLQLTIDPKSLSNANNTSPRNMTS